MRLTNLTWPKAQEYFEKNDMVLISIGSIECHGRHMPLGTDTLIPEHLLEKIEKKSDVLIAPTIPLLKIINKTKIIHFLRSSCNTIKASSQLPVAILNIIKQIRTGIKKSNKIPQKIFFINISRRNIIRTLFTAHIQYTTEILPTIIIL